MKALAWSYLERSRGLVSRRHRSVAEGIFRVVEMEPHDIFLRHVVVKHLGTLHHKGAAEIWHDNVVLSHHLKWVEGYVRSQKRGAWVVELTE